MSFIKKALKTIKNEYASIVVDGLTTDNTGFIDSGSYVVNALLSGSIYGGFASNRCTAVAGESSTGKSFLALTTVKTFLENNATGEVIYFDSEAAFTQEMFEDREIDTSRVAMIPVSSIDEFKTQAFQILGDYEAVPKDERPPLLMILDSLGNLASNKELADTADGKQSQDMTRGRLIRSAFRVLTLKLGKLNVPLIVTNHTYTTMEMYSTQAMGGVGLRYAASTIIFLSKRKERDGEKNVIGNIVHVKTDKSRLTREQLQVDTLIYFDTGMDRYYGLADLAVEFGIFKKVSTRIELPDGSKHFISHINKNPEKFFTKELLDEIDSHCRAKFCYGKRDDNEVLEELEEQDE